MLLMGLFIAAPFGVGNTFGVSYSDAAVFKFRLLAEPATFDWHQASTAVETPLMMNLMEGLTEVDKNLKPVPCLAEKIEISKDQKVYTFTLRKNVKWSDGVVLKAQDFVEGWKRLLDPATAAPYAYLLYDLVGAEDFAKKKDTDFSKVGVTAKGDSTLVVTLKQPVAYFQYLTGFWPLFPFRKDVFDKFGAQWTAPGKLVTIGAYMLESYQKQNKIVMKSNPYYWRKTGNITEAVAQIIKDSSTAMNVFRSGGIQMMQDFSPDDLKMARPMPEYKTFPYLKTYYLAFRVKGSIAENLNFRQAVAHAIDRNYLLSILNGSQKMATSFIPPRVVGFDPKMSIPFDAKLAKEYLAKSGIDPKQELTIVGVNSERPRIVCQDIQSDLKKNLGLNIQIQLLDNRIFRNELLTQNHPLMLMRWSGDYPDGDSFLGIFESGTGNNLTKFSNEKFDDNMKKAREDWNTLKRDKLYKEAQEILQIKEAAIVPLYYEENETLVSKNVKGFYLNPIGYFFIKDISI